MSEENKNEKSTNKWFQNPWLKKIGWIGFTFFLVKGLIWLALGFGLLKWMD
ncbi:hypothetical protein [Crocinitomix catalasitica]|uniref:hypothetical protein n=1 Tax=Crocinitomix catalasitica TaxID=184607 RepID=UPI001B803F42|nr:hypothetical protein [Crocinitomix catalasitica]